MQTECHDVVNYKLFFTQCMDDVCEAKDIRLQCRALADYSMACSKLGVVMGNWREIVQECGKILAWSKYNLKVMMIL